jgi:hypothetical protein
VTAGVEAAAAVTSDIDVDVGTALAEAARVGTGTVVAGNRLAVSPRNAARVPPPEATPTTTRPVTAAAAQKPISAGSTMAGRPVSEEAGGTVGSVDGTGVGVDDEPVDDDRS